jgi:pyrimidine deaminase RibD-like protein
VNQSNNPSVQRLNHPQHPYSWADVPDELLSLFSEQIDPATKRDFMEQAIAEAGKSDLRPTVGSVIVKNNRIIGRGHRKVKKLRDEPPLWRVTHAEQAALGSAGEEAYGATLYVTLEPCAGRYQGPTVEDAEVCSAIIPRAGIATVVIGLVDRDPQTFGKGLRRLHSAGVQLEYAYRGLEYELVELIGDGQFGVIRPKILTVLRKWMNAWRCLRPL